MLFISLKYHIDRFDPISTTYIQNRTNKLFTEGLRGVKYILSRK